MPEGTVVKGAALYGEAAEGTAANPGFCGCALRKAGGPGRRPGFTGAAKPKAPLCATGGATASERYTGPACAPGAATAPAADPGGNGSERQTGFAAPTALASAGGLGASDEEETGNIFELCEVFRGVKLVFVPDV